MSMDERVAAFLKGEALPVAVEAIEQELAALWQATAAQAKAASPPLARRACRRNLFIYSPNEGVYERAASALLDLMRQHPSRVIALIADPETANDELAAYVSAPCHLPSPDAEQWCGEQITMVAKGEAVTKLPAMAISLCVAELPVALWWLGDLPEDHPAFEQLLAASQRLIFDSAFSLDLGNVLSRARALGSTWKGGVGGDLNWLRLARFRELLTQFLDSSDTAPMLSAIEKVSFEVARATEGEAHFAQPFLLLGWLAGRLNWKLNEPLMPAATAEAQTDHSSLVGEESFRTTWLHRDREVVGAITLSKAVAETEETSAPSGIIAAQIQFRQNDNAMTFALRRDPGQSRATIRVTKDEQIVSESTVPFADRRLAELMAQELERTSRDQEYENALRFATQLI